MTKTAQEQIQELIKVEECFLKELRFLFDDAHDRNLVSKQVSVAVMITEQAEKIEKLNRALEWLKQR